MNTNTMMNYSVKEVSSLVGEFFDNFLRPYAEVSLLLFSNFSEIYEKFENNINFIMDDFGITKDDIEIPLSLVVISFDKLKWQFLSKPHTKFLSEGDIFRFLRYFPYILLVVSYYEKYPRRLRKLEKAWFSHYLRVIKNYKNISFNEIFDMFDRDTILEKIMKEIITDYISPSLKRDRRKRKKQEMVYY